MVVLGAVVLRTLVSGGATVPERAAIAASAAEAQARVPDPVSSAGALDAPSGDVRRELRVQLNKDLKTGRFVDFITHLEQLLQIDPTAAQERDIRVAIVDVVLMRIMVGGAEHAEKLFGLLQHRMGTTGIDILYELVMTRGSSRASQRAAELLRDESVRARGTPALRVAYGLRAAPCGAKRDYFERAGIDGDRRALDQLLPLNNDCGRRNRGCCLRDDPGLKAAIAAIKARSP
jgi:serine/threonine-protein kinase